MLTHKTANGNCILENKLTLVVCCCCGQKKNVVRPTHWVEIELSKPNSHVHKHQIHLRKSHSESKIRTIPINLSIKKNFTLNANELNRDTEISKDIYTISQWIHRREQEREKKPNKSIDRGNNMLALFVPHIKTHHHLPRMNWEINLVGNRIDL